MMAATTLHRRVATNAPTSLPIPSSARVVGAHAARTTTTGPLGGIVQASASLMPAPTTFGLRSACGVAAPTPPTSTLTRSGCGHRIPAATTPSTTFPCRDGVLPATPTVATSFGGDSGVLSTMTSATTTLLHSSPFR
jgi:hypothetical protein